MKRNDYLLFVLLFLQSTFGFSQSGVQLFDETYIHSINIHFDQAFYWDTLSQRYLESIDRGPLPDSALGPNNPLLSSYITIDGIRTDSVGVKQKGYYSNWGADSSLKKPLKITFNEFISGRKYDGLTDINLSNSFKDPTMLHDALSYKIMREAGIDAPRTSFANVYINDSLWGIYVVIEQVNKTFLREHFGNDNGNLYKVIESNLENHGLSSEPYKLEFEKKTNESADDWTDIIELVQKINTTSYFVYNDTLPKYIDMEGFLMTLAIDVALNNWDSYFDHGRNFYLYNNPLDNLFHWIPWDYNLSFGQQDYQIMLPDSRERKPIIKRSFNNYELKQQYLAAICEINQHHLTNAKQDPYIDETIRTISSSIENDPNYFYPFYRFNESINIGYSDSDEIAPSVWEIINIKGLKPWISEKNDFLYLELSNEFFECENTLTTKQIILQPELYVYPNPVSSSLFMLPAHWNCAFIQFSIYDTKGMLVESGETDDNFLNVDSLKNGLYILEAKNKDLTYRGKLFIKH